MLLFLTRLFKQDKAVLEKPEHQILRRVTGTSKVEWISTKRLMLLNQTSSNSNCFIRIFFPSTAWKIFPKHKDIK